MTTDKNYSNDHPIEGEDARKHAAATPEQPDTPRPDTASPSRVHRARARHRHHRTRTVHR